MECRTAGHHEHLVDIAQFLIGEPLLIENYPAKVEVPQQGVGHRRRLFGDLLEHEVLVAALFRGRQVPVDREDPRIIGVIVTREVGDAIAVRSDHHNLVLPQFDGFPGVFDECGDVGPEEHLALADTHDQRGGAARGHDRARVVGVGEDEGEVPLQPSHHSLHRRHEVAGGVSGFVLARHQMHGHLGVGVAGELDARGLQLGTQCGEVLDDPVMDHRDLAGRIPMRVSVAVGGGTVSGPAGVPHAGGSAEGFTRFRDRGFQVGQPARLALHQQPAAAVGQRNPRRVIAPVLEPPQRLEDDTKGVPVADVPDDSAHSPPG